MDFEFHQLDTEKMSSKDAIWQASKMEGGNIKDDETVIFINTDYRRKGLTIPSPQDIDSLINLLSRLKSRYAKSDE